MATRAKITQIGNSLGIVLPKDVLADLKVEKGDSIHLVKHPEGYIVSAYDQEFATQMEAMRHIMRDNRDVLRRLAE
jgi:putative addiction module antidote